MYPPLRLDVRVEAAYAVDWAHHSARAVAVVAVEVSAACAVVADIPDAAAVGSAERDEEEPVAWWLGMAVDLQVVVADVDNVVGEHQVH